MLSHGSFLVDIIKEAEVVVEKIRTKLSGGNFQNLQPANLSKESPANIQSKFVLTVAAMKLDRSSVVLQIPRLDYRPGP